MVQTEHRSLQELRQNRLVVTVRQSRSVLTNLAELVSTAC